MLTPVEVITQRPGELSGEHLHAATEQRSSIGDYVEHTWLITFALLAGTGGVVVCRHSADAHRRPAGRHPDPRWRRRRTASSAASTARLGGQLETKHRAMIGDVGGMFNQVGERVGRELTTCRNGTREVIGTLRVRSWCIRFPQQTAASLEQRAVAANHRRNGMR